VRPGGEEVVDDLADVRVIDGVSECVLDVVVVRGTVVFLGSYADLFGDNERVPEAVEL
jgi:hypothetical protein